MQLTSNKFVSCSNLSGHVWTCSGSWCML